MPLLPRPASRGVIATVVLCVLLFVLLAAQVVLQGPLLQADQHLVLWVAAHRQPWLTTVLLAVTEAHETVKLLAATALLAAWRGWRGDRLALRLLPVVPAAMLLNVGLKNAFQRVRPAWEEPLVQIATYSFPSGHAVASSVFYGAACALVLAHARSRALRAAAVALAAAMVLLVCASRVYLGVHFLSDVVAGVAVGTLCLLLFLGFARRAA